MPLRSSGLLHCSFCGKSQNEVKRMIAGLNDNICNNCTIGFLSAPKEVNFANLQIESCDFCGKPVHEVGAFYERKEVKICRGCLDVCQEIIGYDLQIAGA